MPLAWTREDMGAGSAQDLPCTRCKVLPLASKGMLTASQPPSLETESNVAFTGHNALSPGAVMLTAKL